MMVQNYYLILRVKKTATKEEIRRAYRDLAKKYHPDSNHSSRAAEERFKQIVNAYDTLKDPVRRRAYDRQMMEHAHRRAQAQAAAAARKAGPETVVRTRPNEQEHKEASKPAGGIFGSIFTRNRRNDSEMGLRRPGEDVCRNLEIPFEKAARGGVTHLMLEHETVCFFCAGTGSRGNAPTRACTRCRGSGLLSRSNGRLSVSEPCPNCRGRGQVVQHPCSHCQGQGVNVERQQVWVNVPEGIRTGSKIRLPGKGRPGKNGGLPGDLVLSVKVALHPDFRQTGYHLEVRACVDIFTATLGGKVAVPTLNGQVQVVVPPGTRSGRRLRLTGKGIRKPDGTYGDLYIVVEINPPKMLTIEQRVLLRKLRNLMHQFPPSG